MEWTIYILVLLAHLFFHTQAEFSIVKKKIYQNVRYRMAPCHKGARFPMVVNQKVTKATGGVDSVNYSVEFELLEDLYAPIKLKLEVLRCRIADKTDCEAMPDINVNICELGENLLPLVKMLVVTPLKPPFKCPVYEKGVHASRNITLDMSVLATIPMEGHHWKIKESFIFGPKQEELYCNYFEGSVRVAKSNRKNK